MVEDKNINEFKESVLSNILSKIDSKYENPKSIQLMINEVVEDYLNAIKKSIIDYILMDPTERDRLSVYIKYKNPHLYG
jgi:hypothetical protein